ncbi:MAG TPA: mechanosensitive ion channel [Flavobacteriales bacterium]|nr:mechanosensitive ion channel [Flavobacteriales bacterium]
MELPGLTISIIKLLFVGGILWVFFKLVHRAIDLLLSGQAYHKRLVDILLIVRAASWITFIFWSISVIFIGQLMYARIFSGMLILLTVGISWSLIRDIISGFLIRMEGTYHNNSHVRIHDVEGTVRKLGFRSMEIETDRGETIRIPYKIVDDELTVKSYPVETIKSHTFDLSVPKSKEINEYREEIKFQLLNSHWSSLRKDPRVKVIDEVKDAYVLRITAYTLDKKYFQEVERFVKKEFGMDHSRLIEETGDN